MATDSTQAQTYQLRIRLEAALDLKVGKLGRFHFPAGDYVYTGSARGIHAEHRIARHLRREKRLHWHIDYLLTAPGVRVVEVVRARTPECPLNQATPGSLPAPGFGASDCRHGCISHLKYLGPSPDGMIPRLSGQGAVTGK